MKSFGSSDMNHELDCTKSLLMFKLENTEAGNPLECLICDHQFRNPVHLNCLHSFCNECVQNCDCCPICECPVEGGQCKDYLLEYLTEISNEVADFCANCDKVSQPMYFCETCQQALCNDCRQNAHQAKMFSAHRLVPLEERSRAKSRITCQKHDEPYLLFSVDNRSLACIACFNNTTLDSRHHLVHIDAAHKMDCEKLDKETIKLRNFQEDVREQLQMRKRLLTELSDSYTLVSESIAQTCQDMIDKILMVKDDLLEKLKEMKNSREKIFLDQINHLMCLQPSIRLYLLCASVFISSASKLDFLQSSSDLLKRIQSLINMNCEKAQCTGDLRINFCEELRRALEPILNFSSMLPDAVSKESIDWNSNSSISYANLLANDRRLYLDNGNRMHIVSSRCQLIVDLAGAFGEQFVKISAPLNSHSTEAAKLSKEVQEAVKDLTFRRCFINKDVMEDLISRCCHMDVKAGQLSALIYDLQPKLQGIWQEQIDRTHRQHLLFREKIEETIALRENVRFVLSACKQLMPFVDCVLAVTCAVNPMRFEQPSPAPMESLCRQISTIEPNSRQRIEAIEKEEKRRCLAQNRSKSAESSELVSAKKMLKTTREQKLLLGNFVKDDSFARRKTLNMTRERSPGGTDHTLFYPCNRPRGCSSEFSIHADNNKFMNFIDGTFELIDRKCHLYNAECDILIANPNGVFWSLSAILSKNTSRSVSSNPMLSPMSLKAGESPTVRSPKEATNSFRNFGDGVLPAGIRFAMDSILPSTETLKNRGKLLESIKMQVSRIDNDLSDSVCSEVSLSD